MYMKSKRTIKTGSGTFDIEVKEGETKLIILVLLILGLIIMDALAIVLK